MKPIYTKANAYSVYIVECSDGTYYTGVTNNLTRRIHEHNNSAFGARYTKGRRPVVLRYVEELPNRSAAQRREYEIKQLTKVAKRQLIAYYALPKHRKRSLHSPCEG